MMFPRRPENLDQIIDRLALSVRYAVVGICAKVAEIHRIKSPVNEFHNGYNQAVADIAAKIRELNNRDSA